MNNRQAGTLPTALFCGYLLSLSFASAAIPIGGFYLKYDWLGALCLLAFGVLKILMTLRANGETLRYSTAFIAYLILNGLISHLAARDAFNGFGYLSYFLQYMLALGVFITVAGTKINTALITRILNCWVIVACVATVLAILQAALGRLLVDQVLYVPYYEGSNVSWKVVSGVLATTAWFAEASWYGSFLVVPTVFVLVALSQPDVSRRLRFGYLCALVMLVVGLVLGYSLTAILSVAVGLTVLLVFSMRGTTVMWLLAVVVAVAVIASLDAPPIALTRERLQELFFNLRDFEAGSEEYGRQTSFYVRSIGFYAGILDFWNHPFVGLGLGQAPISYHSGAITLLAETGVVGAGVYYWLPVVTIWRLRKARETLVGWERAIALGLIVGLTADYTNGLVTHNGFHLQRWLLVSLAYSWILWLRIHHIGSARTYSTQEA